MILGYHHVKRPTYVWSGIKPGGGYRVVLDLFGPCPHGWVFSTCLEDLEMEMDQHDMFSLNMFELLGSSDP